MVRKKPGPRREADPEGTSRQQPSGVPSWLLVLVVLALGGVAGVIVYGHLERPGWIGVADKKFWDYLELLIVPAALALGVYWLNGRQDERDRKAGQKQHERELEFAIRTTQDAAVQSYIDHMTQLLIEKSAREILTEDRIREPIHARTLHVLDQLDEESPKGRLHKGALIRFLYKTGLVRARRPQHAQDDWRMLYGANLRGACLRGLTLEGADLRDADLSGADLSGANLNRAKITKEQLEQAGSLSGATMPDGQKYEDWLKNRGSAENGGPS